MLLFNACKRLEEPKPEASPNATIEKIKAWYNPKIERLKGAKSTGIDIYYPQWEQGLIHNLPNGEKIAVFPVMREKRIVYFNTGFVRKFVVKLGANDSIQGVKLLEMIGKKEYLRENHQEVARRHFARTAQGMPVMVIERDVPMYVNKSDPCTNCNTWILFWYAIDGGGNGMGFMSPAGVFSFYDLSPSNPPFGFIDAPPSGGMASGYGSFMDSYAPSEYDLGGGSGATPTPDNTIYIDWGAIANIGSFSGIFDMPPMDFGWNVESNAGFKLEGKPERIDEFVRILEEATGNTYDYNPVTKKIVRTSELNTTDNENKSGVLSQLVEDVITEKRCCFKAKIVDKDSQGLFDSFTKTTIDLGDFRQSNSKVFTAMMLGHIIEERLVTLGENGYANKQNRTELRFDPAHKLALKKEYEIIEKMLGLPTNTITERNEVLSEAGTGTVTLTWDYGNGVVFRFITNRVEKTFIDPNTGQIYADPDTGVVLKIPDAGGTVLSPIIKQ